MCKFVLFAATIDPLLRYFLYSPVSLEARDSFAGVLDFLTVRVKKSVCVSVNHPSIHLANPFLGGN